MVVRSFARNWTLWQKHSACKPKATLHSAMECTISHMEGYSNIVEFYSNYVEDCSAGYIVSEKKKFLKPNSSHKTRNIYLFDHQLSIMSRCSRRR